MRKLAVFLLFPALIVRGQEWIRLADFPGTARDDAAGFSLFDKAYVGTGLDFGFQLTNDWYAYDMAWGTWSSIAFLPASGRQYCSSFTLDDHGYLFGGVDANGPLDELWRYAPLSNTWTQVASLPAAGRYACAAFATATHAYICTGMLDNGVPTNEVWRYDPQSDSWDQRAFVPGPPRHRASVPLGVLVGGADGSFQALSDAYIYNELTDTWTSLQGLSEGRYSAGGVEGFLIAGASSLSECHDEVWSYNWSTDAWRNDLLPAFEGGSRQGAAALPNTHLFDVGIIYYGLGRDQVQRYNDWWALNYAVGLPENEVVKPSVHPNPAREQITVTMPGDQVRFRCTLFDNLGREIHDQWTSSGGVIDIAHLHSGRYTLRLVNEKQSWHAALIVEQ